MRILGIDPGYAIMGYGLIDRDGSKLTVIDYGVVETVKDMPFPQRLERLYDGVHELIGSYHPDVAVFEELFFYRNTTTALAVGAGRGVAILAAQKSELPMYEYTPMQIKLSVTGNGHADKKQVQQMVRLLLGLRDIPKPDDAADALAAAICHGCTMGAAAEEFRIR
ncbi:MAG: crossover junction endodeoxyribonuclease RuvC [Eubacteriales bacterium]|nr:crossover junction endodeoxyribonuclease RuvC [Eubacteriales bacterium]